MTAPLVMHTIKLAPRSWKCSCGDHLALANETDAIRSGDRHAALHGRRGEGTSTEYGALHNKAQR